MLTCFLQLSRNCAPQIHTWGSNCQRSFLLGGFEASRDHVHRVRPNLWGDNGWIPHQDNAPSHTALIVREFLAHNSITMMDHHLTR
jgi:hypothetical protein